VARPSQRFFFLVWARGWCLANRGVLGGESATGLRFFLFFFVSLCLLLAVRVSFLGRPTRPGWPAIVLSFSLPWVAAYRPPLGPAAGGPRPGTIVLSAGPAAFGVRGKTPFAECGEAPCCCLTGRSLVDPSGLVALADAPGDPRPVVSPLGLAAVPAPTCDRVLALVGPFARSMCGRDAGLST